MGKRIAVIASGRGSNFQAIIDAITAGTINATCVALITDNPVCQHALLLGVEPQPPLWGNFRQ